MNIYRPSSNLKQTFLKNLFFHNKYIIRIWRVFFEAIIFFTPKKKKQKFQKGEIHYGTNFLKIFNKPIFLGYLLIFTF